MNKLIQWVDDRINYHAEAVDFTSGYKKIANAILNLEQLSNIRKNLSQARYYDALDKKALNEDYSLTLSCEHNWIPMEKSIECKHCGESRAYGSIQIPDTGIV